VTYAPVGGIVTEGLAERAGGAPGPAQRRYRVVEADLARDRHDILDLWARNLPPGTFQLASYPWFLEQNPYGPGRCWLLLGEPGARPVGTCATTPFRVKVGERTVEAGLASWLNVDAEHRTVLPALMLIRALAAGERTAFVYARPNQKAVGVFRRSGYQPFGETARFVKVLQVEPYLERVHALSRWAGVLAWPLDRARCAASPETWLPREGRRVEPCSAFDERFDDLWERAAPHYGVVTERRSRFLQWRYQQSPDQSFKILAASGPDRARLEGYCVYYLDGPHVQVVDLFASDPGRQLTHLVAGVIRWAREQGAVSISLEGFGPGHLQRTLQRFGFRRRGPSQRVVLVSPPARPDLGLQRWYFTAADTARD
jgi:hypothetical protein